MKRYNSINEMYSVWSKSITDFNSLKRILPRVKINTIYHYNLRDKEFDNDGEGENYVSLKINGTDLECGDKYDMITFDLNDFHSYQYIMDDDNGIITSLIIIHDNKKRKIEMHYIE